MSMSDIAHTAVERLTECLATTILEPGGRSRMQENLLPLTSTFFLSGSPVPYLSSQTWDETKDTKATKFPLSTSTLSSISRPIVDILLKHYCEIYLPQYPAVEESDLYKACDRVYNNLQPSGFDIFCVHITLAISMTTLMHRDEKRAMIAIHGFWTMAVAHLDQVGLANLWERLQALQLLAHYAFLNPKNVDCSNCAAAATRLSLQLGLHHESSAPAQMKLDTTTLNTRRRLFWNSYAIDCAAHTTRCRPFIWPSSTITARFPDFDSQSSLTLHVWLLRQIESEITLAMYHPSLAPEELISSSSFSRWFARTHERLNEWYQTIRQSINHTEKIKFHELQFQSQMLRLNRPSPRCPNPTMNMRKKALQSSIALIKEFSIIDQMGNLFYLWHAAHYIIESGVCLLASVLTGMDSADQNHSQLGGEDITNLIKYMKIFPYLLEKVSLRWPNVARHASALDVISHSVLGKLEQWSRGEMIESHDFSEFRQKLNEFSLFSPFPLESQATADNLAAKGEYGFHPTLDSNAFPSFITDFGVSFDYSNLSAPATVTTSINPGWVGLQSTQEHNSATFPDPYSVDSGAALVWDIAGMDSDEILAALVGS
ncbi:hypothetical protein N7474_008970 [Penicillium riverlandense]|uniref:uncharacterized protein n=1 Tax=Penicillium riverlandense TaxID=1903569 RepID=UPI00254768A1|nr:uncharacterized protein N7474_008970 [Penicillium riverlandense]KAJ5812669.1 hypothetical protein N7474_008970 [Penicillium riverlandense]